jgi:hypothetical protein
VIFSGPAVGGSGGGAMAGSGMTTNESLPGGLSSGMVPTGVTGAPTVAEPALIVARIGSDDALANIPTMNR